MSKPANQLPIPAQPSKFMQLLQFWLKCGKDRPSKNKETYGYTTESAKHKPNQVQLQPNIICQQSTEPKTTEPKTATVQTIVQNIEKSIATSSNAQIQNKISLKPTPNAATAPKTMPTTIAPIMVTTTPPIVSVDIKGAMEESTKVISITNFLEKLNIHTSDQTNVHHILRTIYKKSGRISTMTEVDAQKITRAINACRDSHKHGNFNIQNVIELCDFGKILLTKLYAVDNPSDLRSDAHYQTLPKWLGEISSLNLFGYAKLDGEISNQNRFFASWASVLNKMNVVTKSYNAVLNRIEEIGSKQDELDNHSNLRKNYLTAIICMMWAIYFDAAYQGEDFLRGSYKIIDQHNRLYNCLLDYVKFATKNPDPTGVLPNGMYIPAKSSEAIKGLLLKTDINRLLSRSNEFAYSRSPNAFPPLSSHYPNDPLQWGIDLRFDSGQLATNFLPGKNSHILFGLVKTRQEKGYPEATFIKFEPDPLGSFAEVGSHAISFLKSHHVEDTARREKDIDAELQKIYQEFISKLPIKILRKQTIQEMYQTMKKIIEDLSALNPPEHGKIYIKAKSKLIQKFEGVAQIKGLGHLDMRTGNEVILDFTSIYKTSHVSLNTEIHTHDRSLAHVVNTAPNFTTSNLNNPIINKSSPNTYKF